MGLIARLGSQAAQRPRFRGAAFPAAEIGRLTASWTTDPGAINRWLRHELRTLRARSRQLARGDAYGAKFIRACEVNIAGAHPFILQMKAKFRTGAYNVPLNTRIETAFRERCLPGRLEVTGRLSMGQFIRVMVRTLARDGEVLVRRYQDNTKPFGGAGKLQLIDIDRLDENYNEVLQNGNTIKMSVELDPFCRPIAYHILRSHPGELGEWSRGGATRQYDRITADQIMHIFAADWPEQVRGFPWLHAAMVRLHHLGEFEAAAVINARVGAMKIATIETPEGDVPESLVTGKDSAGNLLTDGEAGQYWALPPGGKLGSFNPTFPDQAVGPFIQAALRGAAAAVNMAYHSFANDPGEVNYSTARVALIDERDGWSCLQQMFKEQFCIPDFRDWMRGASLDGTLRIDDPRHADAARFQPRTWDWIDPEKEVKAKVLALDKQLISRTRIAAQHGDDFEEVIDELAADQQLAAAKGVKLNDATAQGGTMSGQAAQQEQPEDAA